MNTAAVKTFLLRVVRLSASKICLRFEISKRSSCRPQSYHYCQLLVLANEDEGGRVTDVAKNIICLYS